MEKTFWLNPYQTKLDTKVSFVQGEEVVFNETIAYSFSGGQESDIAFVNNMLIESSRIENNFIYYKLPKGHNLNPGDAVYMTIDWPRRSRLMRLHFAAELILEIVTKKWALEKLGAHISETKARIDFKSESNIKSKFEEILILYNDIIERNLPIHKGYLDIKTQKRFWEIDGFAKVPCGGTHVNTTGEVGLVTLKREHPGKSVERIEIRLVK